MNIWFFFLLCIFFPFDVQECVAKEKEERKRPPKETEEQDEIPLFYSDLMPLLVRKLYVIS